MTVVAACALAACNSGTVTGPDPVETVAQAPEPVAAATPAPQPVAQPENPSPSFGLSCKSGSTLNVKYNGPASRATIETFYTSFDNQDLVFGKQSHTVNAGDSVTRTFGACQQADADQPGVKLIGGCFFDKRGEPFNPTRSPEKVAECRTPTPRPTPSPEPTCEDSNPEAGLVTKSIKKETWVSSGSEGSDAVTANGYQFGNNDTKNVTACTGNGGTWHGGNIKLCQIAQNFGSTWRGTKNDDWWDSSDNAEGNPAPFDNGSWTTGVVITAATPDTRKYSVKVTLTWSIAAGAAQSKTFKIVYDGDFVKKQVTVSVACGEAKQGTLVWQQGDQYNSSPNYSPDDGHVTGNYSAVVN